MLSGYVAVFPVVTFLSLTVLVPSSIPVLPDVSGFLTGALSGVIITGFALVDS